MVSITKPFVQDTHGFVQQEGFVEQKGGANKRDKYYSKVHAHLFIRYAEKLSPRKHNEELCSDTQSRHDKHAFLLQRHACHGFPETKTLCVYFVSR